MPMALIRLLVLWLGFGVAIAQENPSNDLKVGFVNIRQLIANAPQIKQVQTKLATEFEDKNQAIIALRNEIVKLSASYDQQPSKDEQLALQKQIDDKQLELSKLQQFMQDEFNLRRNEALGKVQTLIVKMVAKVSKEKQLDIVLNNTGVVYVSNRIDITPDVFKYLSEQEID